jgi:hypothetical protein
MSGQAMSAVSSQMGVLNGYASSALSAASGALSSLSDISFPSFYASFIGISALSSPSPVLPSQPGGIVVPAAPSITNLVSPEKVSKPSLPTVTLGEMLSISIPEVPTIEFPELNLTAPTYSFTEPTNWNFSVSDILITDDPFMKAAIDRLTSNIQNGGTGLTAAVEDAIWARGLERDEQQLEDSTDKVSQMWAKRGFTLPDGMLSHALSEIQKEHMNRRLDRTREIEIKQAELEQVNLFKSLDLSVNLASQLITMLIRYEEMVQKANENTAKFANEYIDLQIKTYAAKLEGYKATASVHESLVRANIAKVEVYKAQIEGEKAVLDANDQTVKIYAEKLRATQIMMDSYKTEVEAMVAELNIEKAKIESNKIQFDSWAKQVDVNIAKYSGEVELFKATSAHNVASAEVSSKYAEASMRAAIAQAEVNVSARNAEVSNMNAQAQIRMEAARGVAQATAAMAAGAMAAMSAHASMSYAESQPLEEIAT